MKFSGKKLLVLGGDLLSCDIVNKAHEMGLYVIVTDWYDSERSPAKLLADEFWMTSIEDYDKLAMQINEHHIDGVITGFTDSYLLPYQRICEMTNMPCYGNKQQFEIFTDKERYKKLCRQFNIPTIEEYSIDSIDIKYPVLVKPVDGSGSRGIVICNNHKELSEALEIAKKSSRQNRAIIERYMDCPEATVFWLFVNGQYYLTMIGNRHVKHNQDGNIIPLPVGYTFPSYLTPKYQKEVEDNAKRMFGSLGVKNGMMFMQCKVENGNCYVYDIGYRLTGSREYKIQEKIWGHDTMSMLINFAITGNMCDYNLSDIITPCTMIPSFNVSSLCAPGKIKAIKGVEQVKKIPGVVDVAYAHKPGHIITEEMKGQLAQIAIRTLGIVTDKSDLYAIMSKIDKTIIILSDKDENLLLSGIEESDLTNMIL